MHKGPFATVRSVQRSFSGKSQRPTSENIIDIFKAMEEDGLGSIKVVNKITVFYKVLPCDVFDKLDPFNIGQESYSSTFRELCSLSQISKEHFNKFLDNSPSKNDLKEVYFFENYE